MFKRNRGTTPITTPLTFRVGRTQFPRAKMATRGTTCEVQSPRKKITIEVSATVTVYTASPGSNGVKAQTYKTGTHRTRSYASGETAGSFPVPSSQKSIDAKANVTVESGKIKGSFTIGFVL